MTLNIALIGTGGIMMVNHIPGISHIKNARVHALCDPNPAALERARLATGVQIVSTDYREIVKREDVHAVIIGTPNVLHREIALAAIAAGKHVMSEKPLAMNLAETIEMARAADKAGVRHMTAFTYRFAPAMQYMKHIVKDGGIGTPYHFRAQRFQDWGSRNIGWRQVKALAGSGETGDMLSHRIDFGHVLFGDLSRVIGHTRRWQDVRDGAPNDLEDWSSCIGDFANGATGLWESSKQITGFGESGRSRDLCEVNGSDASIIYDGRQPNVIRMGRKGDTREMLFEVPAQFARHPASTRDPLTGDPVQGFRYDQDAEFVDAIVNQRPCSPSFWDGVRAQTVIDALLDSAEERAWVPISYAN